MTDDITPFNFDDSGIRWDHKDGEDWAVLNDFCDHIGISRRRAAYYGKALFPKGYSRLATATDSLGRSRETYVINKLGIAYILKTSNKEIPKAFQDWLGTEVFESILEDGGYVAPWATVEQLARVQEKIDYSMLRSLLAKASDYSPNADITKFFFSVTQNAFYRTVVGMSAENIRNSGREIVNYTGKKGPTKQDLKVAKNYLVKDELELLGLYVTNAITQTRLRFHKKEYSMDEFIDAVKESMKKSWEK